jgi:transcriptional regulator with XRE-family HTH domain
VSSEGRELERTLLERTSASLHVLVTADALVPTSVQCPLNSGIVAAMDTAPRAGHSTDGLGERLRDARERQGIGVRELARRVGVSASLISTVETGKSTPSVSTLWAIAGELGLPLSRIFDGPSPRSPVQLATSRPSVQLDTGVVWERLTPEQDAEVDFVLVRYPPGGASTCSETLMRHAGREYGYVVSGRLRVSIGFDDYELGRGDSIVFDSAHPHRLATIGDEPVEAVWFVLGRH